MFSRTYRQLALGMAAFAFLGLSSVAQAQDEHVAPVTEFLKGEVAGWVSDPVVVEAIKAQNAKNADLSEADVVALDNTWRAETDSSDQPLISAVLGNDLSQFLSAKKEAAGGMVTEVFVMDNKGLNVGQSDVTSDYWQGDEGKWQKTFQAGPDAVFVDEVELDESTQTFQTQGSMSIVDPATGEVIGAITVGLDAEAL
ncbi:hypothetical protein ACTL6U_20060 [Rhodovibrionaceae bacterium A322]